MLEVKNMVPAVNAGGYIGKHSNLYHVDEHDETAGTQCRTAGTLEHTDHYSTLRVM